MALTPLDKGILFIGHGPIVKTYLHKAKLETFQVVSNNREGLNSGYAISYHQSTSYDFQNIDCVVISTRLDLMTGSLRNLLLSLIKKLERVHKISRVIILSSVSVYGDSRNKCDERSSALGTSRYANSKIDLEELVRLAFPLANVTAMRISNVFGHPLFKDVVNIIVKSIATSGEVLLPHEDNYRDFIYVDDLCEILHFLLGIEKLLPEVINVGRGESISIYQLAEHVIEYCSETYGQITIKKNLVSAHNNSFIDTKLLRSIFPMKQNDFYLQLSHYLVRHGNNLLTSKRSVNDFV